MHILAIESSCDETAAAIYPKPSYGRPGGPEKLIRSRLALLALFRRTRGEASEFPQETQAICSLWANCATAAACLCHIIAWSVVCTF